MVEEKKFGMVGVGPTGGIMAAYLANAGHKVVLVDILKDHMDEIKKNGLKLTHYSEFTAEFPQENICYSIEELQDKAIDTFFIAVKASQLKKVLPQVKKIAKPHSSVVSLQNGFDTEELISEYFGKENAIRVVINYAGNVLNNGVIRMSFFNPPNYIGGLVSPAEEKGRGIQEKVDGRQSCCDPEAIQLG